MTFSTIVVVLCAVMIVGNDRIPIPHKRAMLAVLFGSLALAFWLRS